MSLFNGLGTAKVYESGNYFTPGWYLLQVKRVIAKTTERSGECLIVEFNVTESQSTGQANSVGVSYVPLSVGSDGTWLQSLKDRNIALPAIKSFLYAVLGIRPSDSSQAHLSAQIDALADPIMNLAVSEHNVLQGLYVNLDAEIVKTKKGGDFTKHKWIPIKPQNYNLAPLDLNVFFEQVKAYRPAPVQYPQYATPALQAPPPPPQMAPPPPPQMAPLASALQAPPPPPQMAPQSPVQPGQTLALPNIQSPFFTANRS